MVFQVFLPDLTEEQFFIYAAALPGLAGLAGLAALVSLF
jgi:hypothetical protein